MNGSTLCVSRELSSIVSERTLGHNQVTEVDTLRITSTDPGHNGNTRLALLQNAGKVQRHLLRPIARQPGDMQGQEFVFLVLDAGNTVFILVAQAGALFNAILAVWLQHVKKGPDL